MRTLKTRDGFTFKELSNGEWTDGDMTFASLDELRNNADIHVIWFDEGPDCVEFNEEQEHESLQWQAWFSENVWGFSSFEKAYMFVQLNREAVQLD